MVMYNYTTTALTIRYNQLYCEPGLKPGSQYDAVASVASRTSPAKTGVPVHN